MNIKAAAMLAKNTKILIVVDRCPKVIMATAERRRGLNWPIIMSHPSKGREGRFVHQPPVINDYWNPILNTHLHKKLETGGWSSFMLLGDVMICKHFWANVK